MPLLRAVAVALIVLTALLTPLAQASPPDQTWISGFYDNADYDDAVVSITSTAATAETNPLGDLVAIHVVIRAVPTPQPEAPPSRESAPQDSRAPPAV